jgi:hypothetical protein
MSNYLDFEDGITYFSLGHLRTLSKCRGYNLWNERISGDYIEGLDLGLFQVSEPALSEETGEKAKSNFMKKRWPPGLKEYPKHLE